MPHPLVASSGLLLLFAVPGASSELPAWGGVVDAIQQHATVHVPRMTITRSSTTIIMRETRRIRVVEKKADDCVKMDQLSGFTVNRFDSVDLMLKDGKLLRARLGADCPALGFYSGFYVKPNKDKKICAKRDSFRSRSGRSCAVEAFRALVPAE